MKDTVGVVLYDACIFLEVALALELAAEKFRVVALTPEGSVHKASNGLHFSETRPYKDLDFETCAGILVPGGNPESVAENEDLMNLIRNVDSQNILIGAICAGPSILAKAGILKGRKIAHGYEQEQLDFLNNIFEGVVLTDEIMVHDENILTAKPEAHIDFAVDFAHRIGVISDKSVARFKNYYKGFSRGRTRILALAVIQNSQGQFLLHQGSDSVKKETFYRPLGGGVEFGEEAKVAVQREIQEELGVTVHVGEILGFIENVFTYEGRLGHEFVILHKADFSDLDTYTKTSFEIKESGQVLGQAVWRSIEEIRNEGARLYPQGLLEKLRGT